MKTAERERIKHNEAADAIAWFSLFVASHGRTIALAAIAAVIVVGGILGYNAYRARTEERAHEQLQAAIETARRPVVAPAEGQPPAEGSFATEAERTSAVIGELQAVADGFPGTDAGLQARYYAASLLAESGRLEEAAAAYQQVIDRSGSSILGRMATLGLATVQVRAKQFDSAIATFQSLASSGDDLPTDGILMQLADAYAQAGRHSEAIDTFKRVAGEFPQSPYAAEARERADRLQADVPAAS